MEIAFSGPVFEWRGPPPFYYVALPQDDSDDIRADQSVLSYGWGCIPVTAVVGATTFTTSLFPKDGVYLLGLKAAVRRSELIESGDVVEIRLTVEPVGGRGGPVDSPIARDPSRGRGPRRGIE